MSEVKTTCKFCGKSIVLNLTVEWDSLGRTIKDLLPLVCCNPCAKSRERLRETASEMGACCVKWSRLPVGGRADVSSSVRQRLSRILMDHLAALATIRGARCPDFEQAIVDQLMDYPAKWFDTLKQAREMVRPQF